MKVFHLVNLVNIHTYVHMYMTYICTNMGAYVVLYKYHLVLYVCNDTL
jgi:hypothetical protein